MAVVAVLLSTRGYCFVPIEEAFVKTKGKLLDECNLWCVLSLPGGVFTQAGAGVKTNLLFFTKGEPTRTIWYYDLSEVKVTKKKPFTLSEFEDFFNLLPQRGDSESSWTIDFTARKAKAAEEAKPFHEQARAKQQEVARWKEHLVELKKAPREQKDINAIEAAENQIKTLTKEANTLKLKFRSSFLPM